MPHDFVILFSAREGSSALIDLLGRHPDIQVPIFEHLDHTTAGKICDADGIARLLDLVLATGDHAEACRLFAAGSEPPPARGAPVVGFKWRLWGEPDAVAETFARRQVTVFHLYRLKLRELVTSIMFTDEVLPALRQGGADLPEGHLQFDMLSMDEASRAALRARLAQLHFRLDPAAFADHAGLWLRNKTEMVDRYIRPMRARGVKVYAVLYEDFSDNQAALVRRICAAIGVDPGPLASVAPAYKKVHEGLLTHQVENWADINANPALGPIVRQWHALIEDSYPPLPDAA